MSSWSYTFRKEINVISIFDNRCLSEPLNFTQIQKQGGKGNYERMRLTLITSIKLKELSAVLKVYHALNESSLDAMSQNSLELQN